MSFFLNKHKKYVLFWQYNIIYNVHMFPNVIWLKAHWEANRDGQFSWSIDIPFASFLVMTVEPMQRSLCLFVFYCIKGYDAFPFSCSKKLAVKKKFWMYPRAYKGLNSDLLLCITKWASQLKVHTILSQYNILLRNRTHCIFKYQTCAICHLSWPLAVAALHIYSAK